MEPRSERPARAARAILLIAAACGGSLRAPRRGITLMEVLISMAVLLIGLLGVFSMIPVAKSYMADGVKYDAVSSIGQRAIHDLEVRTELLDPSNWFSPSGNGQFLEVCPPPGKGNPNTTDAAYNYYWSSVSPVQTIPAAPFILDPLGCAYSDNLAMNGGTEATSPSGQTASPGAYGPTFFPPRGYAVDTTGAVISPALNRITVPMRGSISSVAFPFGPMRFCKPMVFAQAAKVFQSSDDLLFNRPDDTTQRPFIALPSPASPSQYSTSQGDYSWFAVIDNVQKPWNPGPNGGWGVSSSPPNPATDDDNGDGVINDIGEAGWPGTDDIALWKLSGGQLWHVSVAVVHKRNLQLVTYTSTDIPPERMCYCDFLSAPFGGSGSVASNAGLGGGDCVLSISNAQAPSGDWLNVKQNQWIMVSAWPAMANLTTGANFPGQLPLTQWFRISSVGDIVQSAAGWQRTVTLVGPDWNPYRFRDAAGQPQLVGLQYQNYQTCYATIVDGVVGVVEAEIEQGE